jgi:hypothetical protein
MDLRHQLRLGESVILRPELMACDIEKFDDVSLIASSQEVDLVVTQRAFAVVEESDLVRGHERSLAPEEGRAGGAPGLEYSSCA